MTFYEAAIEVLRRSGRPLHYKKITEIAVREELLSHVGKTPHLTMNDRLEKEIQKNEASAIDKERPGVFKLDEEHADEIAERIKQKRIEEQKRKKQRSKQSGRDQKRHENQSSGGQSQNRNRDQNRGNDQGGDDSPKRRRSRGSKKEQSPQPKKKRRDRDDSDRGDDRNQQKSSQSKSRDSKSRNDGGPRRQRRRKRDGGDGAGADLDLATSTDEHLDNGPVQLKGIPHGAYRVLDEAGAPLESEELADRVFEQDLVKFHTHSPVATVESALANDNQIRQEQGHRQLFERIGGDRWRLTEWDLDDDIHQREQAALSLTEEIRQATARQLGRALVGIKSEALEHLALTLLERLGYHNIKVSKRSSQGDVFFTADWRQGLADVRVCVQVVTDHDRTLQPDTVEDLRETLDHYSASEGLIIHLGSIADNAVTKGRIEGEAPITLFDQTTFVELLIKHGIGIRTYENPIVTVDADFIDALAN